MAATYGLFVTVRGTGGHGSAPHRARDPISVAAEMVTALQTMVTRQFDMFDPVVITVGTLPRGHPAQHHPGAGDLRRDRPDVLAGRAGAHRDRVGAAVRVDRRGPRLEADVRFSAEYPVTVNDPAQAAFATDGGRGRLRAGPVHADAQP